MVTDNVVVKMFNLSALLGVNTLYVSVQKNVNNLMLKSLWITSRFMIKPYENFLGDIILIKVGKRGRLRSDTHNISGDPAV